MFENLSERLGGVFERLTKQGALTDADSPSVAGQFQWTFEYLDETGENTLYTQLLPGGEDGGMVVPAGRTVQCVGCDHRWFQMAEGAASLPDVVIRPTSAGVDAT